MHTRNTSSQDRKSLRWLRSSFQEKPQCRRDSQQPVFIFITWHKTCILCHRKSFSIQVTSLLNTVPQIYVWKFNLGLYYSTLKYKTENFNIVQNIRNIAFLWFYDSQAVESNLIFTHPVEVVCVCVWVLWAVRTDLTELCIIRIIVPRHTCCTLGRVGGLLRK